MTGFVFEVERYLVGLEGKVDNMVKLFRLKEERNVFFLLLWGMGGIGKTVLAQAIFYRLGKEFQVKSFVKDCAEGADKIQQSLLNDLLLRKNFPGDLGAGKTCLREGLRAKVLIVLDDTKNFKSIEEAIDLKSLHTGSLILVTSRIRTVFPDETYLSDVFKGERYEVQGMNDDESLRLLCLRAFKKPFPETDLQVLAERVSHACGGLPLSLDVVGCDLSGIKKKKLWEDAIEKLRSNQYSDIEKSLMISYEALNDSAKEMFLDVACLLINEDKRCAKYFWDGSGSVTAWRSALNSLVDGCLVKVCKNKRRDKDYEEYKSLTMHVQLRDLGRAIVKKEYEKSGKWSRVWRDPKISLRVLRRKQGLHQIRGLVTSPPSLNASLLSQMESLQLLFMDGGEQLDGNDEGLEQLGITWLKLTSLRKGAATKIPVLESLTVESLTVLELDDMEMELPFFDGQLKKLPPSFVQLKELRKLSINIKKLECLPEDFGSLENLEQLDVRYSAIRNLPSSFGKLKMLRKLSLHVLKDLESLPEDFGSLEKLEELNVSHSIITNLPSTFGKLKKLRKLSIIVLKDLEDLPEDFGSLENLKELSLSGSAIKKLPTSFVQLKKLQKLDVSWCVQLEQLPADFGSLESLQGLDVTNSAKLPFEHLEKLRKLERGLCHGFEWNGAGRRNNDPAPCGDLLKMSEMKIE